MSVKSIFFDLWYRFGKTDWVIVEPQPDLAAAVSQGVIRGPSVLDIGCGTVDNAVYLVEHGFSVTGVDVYAAAALTGCLGNRSSRWKSRWRLLTASACPAR